MARKHRYPTRRQLEEGAVIACKGSGDEDLEEMHATHVRLLLSETLAEPDDDEEDDDDGDDGGDHDAVDVEDDPEAGDDERPGGLAYFKDPDREFRRVQRLDEDEIEAGLEVHVRLPRRRRWFYVGNVGDYPETPWRHHDAYLLMGYLDRLVAARNLDELLDLDDDEDDEWEEYEEPVDSKIIHVSGDAEFRREVLRSDVPVVVDFTAQWCGPCLALAPHLVQIAAEREGEVKVVKVDIDANEKLAEKYGVEAVPTLLLFRGGVKVDEMEGFEGKRELVSWIASVCQI